MNPPPRCVVAAATPPADARPRFWWRILYSLRPKVVIDHTRDGKRVEEFEITGGTDF
jgi:hypothetical protein